MNRVFSGVKSVAPRLLLVLGAVVMLTGASRPTLLACGLATVVQMLVHIRMPQLTSAKFFACALGGLLPLVPCLGSEVLVVAGLVFFALSNPRVGEPGCCWPCAVPLLAYLVGTVVGEAAIAFDLFGVTRTSFLSGVVIDGMPRLVDVWVALVQEHVRSARWLVRLLLFIRLVGFFSKEVEGREGFLKGLRIGLPVSAVYAIARWSGWSGFSFDNQGEFWSSIHRISGLLSDPNALGLAMALGLWCIVWKRLSSPVSARYWDVVWVALVTGAGFVSGSRTFLLGTALLLVSIAWTRARPWFVGIVAVAVCFVFAITALDSSSDLLNKVSRNESVPEGLKRGLSALSLSRVEETFGTRILFVKIAQRVVAGYESLGIGVDRFRDYVPYVGVRTGLVRGWTDNANNFYLALLVELGIVGSVLALFAAVGRRIRVAERHSCGGTLIVSLAILMLTGPHTDFPEVLILVAFLVGAITEPRRMPQALTSACLYGGLILGVSSSYTHEQGMQPWKEEREGATRWLSNRATVAVDCSDTIDGEAPRASMVLSPVYIPQRVPLTVKIYKGASVLTRVDWSSQERRTVTFDCDNPGRASLVTVVTEPPWSPYRAWPGSSGDRRLLGVQQHLPY